MMTVRCFLKHVRDPQYGPYDPCVDGQTTVQCAHQYFRDRLIERKNVLPRPMKNDLPPPNRRTDAHQVRSTPPWIPCPVDLGHGVDAVVVELGHPPLL